MIYRIDFKHFLGDMIDFFTIEEITHMQYAIISASIINGGRATNMAKLNDLYPEPDVVATYVETNNLDVLEKMYFNQLDPKDDDFTAIYTESKIYRAFLNPLLQHSDICIICAESENVFIDVLCKFLNKKYDIDVIDLNQLFSTGRVGPIYIDRSELHDRCVDIRRRSLNQQKIALESTKEGRADLVYNHMSKKDKIHKLKQLGIQITSKKNSDLDELLLHGYINEDDD